MSSAESGHRASSTPGVVVSKTGMRQQLLMFLELVLVGDQGRPVDERADGRHRSGSDADRVGSGGAHQRLARAGDAPAGYHDDVLAETLPELDRRNVRRWLALRAGREVGGRRSDIHVDTDAEDGGETGEVQQLGRGPGMAMARAASAKTASACRRRAAIIASVSPTTTGYCVGGG